MFPSYIKTVGLKANNKKHYSKMRTNEPSSHYHFKTNILRGIVEAETLSRSFEPLW